MILPNAQPGTCVLTEQQISTGVKRVAEQLNREFTSIVAITVVPGGLFFCADLLRQLSIDVKMDTISCPHTPGERHNASPIHYYQNAELSGQDVILIDDAIESGGTMKRLIEHISSHYGARSVSVATLFVKPGRIALDARQFYAYELDSDELVVGYGLPWQHRWRHLPYLARLENPPG